MPSASLRLGCGKPAASRPRRRAMEERTSSASRVSPSIAEDFTTSAVITMRLASLCRSKPRASIFPSKRPCSWRTAANGATRVSLSQVSFGQPGDSWIQGINHRSFCGDYSTYSPHGARFTALNAVNRDLFAARLRGSPSSRQRPWGHFRHGCDVAALDQIGGVTTEADCGCAAEAYSPSFSKVSFPGGPKDARECPAPIAVGEVQAWRQPGRGRIWRS